MRGVFAFRPAKVSSSGSGKNSAIRHYLRAAAGVISLCPAGKGRNPRGAKLTIAYPEMRGNRRKLEPEIHESPTDRPGTMANCRGGPSTAANTASDDTGKLSAFPGPVKPPPIRGSQRRPVGFGRRLGAPAKKMDPGLRLVNFN